LLLVALLAVSAASCRGRSISYPDPVYSDAGNARSDAADGGHVDATVVVTDVREDNPAALADGRCVSGAFKRDGACGCQASLPDVCDDACTNLSNDDANCGACGHACGPTSPCVAGVCSPAPKTVVTAPAGCGKLDLAATADLLYWADAGHGTITMLGGGLETPAVIATGEDAPRSIVARGAVAAWVGGAGKQLRRGGPALLPMTLATSDTDIRGAALSGDGLTVYYSSGTDVLRVSVNGGTSTVVARDTHDGHPAALALDEVRLAFVSDLTHVVYVATLVEGQLATCGQFEKDVSCSMLARGAPKYLEQIAAMPGQVVWGLETNLVIGTSNPVPNPPDNMSIGAPNGTLTGLAVTATSGYFSDSGYEAGTGSVYRTAFVSGGAQVPLARNQNAPRAVTVGATRVFWSTGDCTIEATNL
jgi:hypothetical protein